MSTLEGLEGKLAVVTGASRGIGRATARLLARRGARVVGCSLRAAAAQSFMADLTEAERSRCAFMACDVAQSAHVKQWAALVHDRFGVPDIVVNNAGIVVRAVLEDIDDDAWRHVMAANVDGTFFVTRAFLPGMKARGTGKIINISSIAGRQGTPNLVAYCTAKHAVVGFTRALSEELRGTQIRVNAVCPGSVDTDMLKVGMPGGRPNMQPEDIANVVAYLAVGAPMALMGACVDVFG